MKYFMILLSSVVLIPWLSMWLVYPVIVFQRNQSDPIHNSYTIESNMDHVLKDVDISIVFPAYNEEQRLPCTLDSAFDYIQNNNPKDLIYEVIIVDDGSTDQTVKVGKQYMTKYSNIPIHIVKLNKNRGKGGAVKTGVTIASGKYVLMADADGATDINDLTKLYNQIQIIEKPSERLGGQVGIAIGSRAHLEKQSISTRAFYRTILMHGFHILVTIMCTKAIRDTQCGFKLFTQKAAQALFQNVHLERWAFDIEVIYLAESLGIPITEVAVNWQEIPGSKLIKSKLDVITTSLEMARDIVCIRLSYFFSLWKISVQV